MATLLLFQPGAAENRQIDALGSAACENHLARFARQHFGGPVPRVIQQRTRPPADVMDTGGIAENLAKIWQHGLPYRGIQRGRGVIIKIDASHREHSKNSS